MKSFAKNLIRMRRKDETKGIKENPKRNKMPIARSGNNGIEAIGVKMKLIKETLWKETIRIGSVNNCADMLIKSNLKM